MASDLTSHRYMPLRHCEIRVFSIKPGAFNDIVSCTFKVINLLEGPRNCAYEALSYCWNDGCLDVRFMLLNGTLFSTTCSLQAALQHLRRPDRERVFWIDAICIDQSNDDEKSMQVPLMRRIYSNASSVVIWLGKSTALMAQLFKDLVEPRGKRGFDEITRRKVEKLKLKREKRGAEKVKGKNRSDDDSDLSSSSDSDTDDEHSDDASDEDEDAHWQSDSMSSSDSDGSSESSRNRYDVSSSHQACRELVSRQWFGRVWIVQEVCLSQTEPIVMCGPHALTWSQFVIGARDLLNLATVISSDGIDDIADLDSSETYTEALRSIESLNQARSTWQNSKSSHTPSNQQAGSCTLLRQLCSTRGRQCTWRVDQVYGILGICTDVEQIDALAESANNPVPQIPFAVAYDEEPRRVFIRTVAHCIESERNLNVLGAIYHTDYEGGSIFGNDDNSDSDDDGIRSSLTWVPDWTDPGRPHTFTSLLQSRKCFSAATHLPPEWEIREEKYLYLKGIKVTKVTSVLDIFEGDNDVFESRDESSSTQMFNLARALCRSVGKRRKKGRMPGSSPEFWGMLCRDARLHGVDLVDGDADAIVSWLQASERTHKSPPTDERLKMKLHQMIVALTRVVKPRRIAYTADGRFGLMPSETKKGDKIAVFLGGETPFVVRSKGDKYILVGECFCEGVMDGEASIREYKAETFVLI